MPATAPTALGDAARPVCPMSHAAELHHGADRSRHVPSGGGSPARKAKMSNARRFTIEAIGLALILAAGFAESACARTDHGATAPTAPATVATVPAPTVPQVPAIVAGSGTVPVHCEIVSTASMPAAVDYAPNAATGVGEWYAAGADHDGPYLGASLQEDGIVYRSTLAGASEADTIAAANACALASPLYHE